MTRLAKWAVSETQDRVPPVWPMAGDAQSLASAAKLSATCCRVRVELCGSWSAEAGCLKSPGYPMSGEWGIGLGELEIEETGAGGGGSAYSGLYGLTREQ